MSQTDKTHTQRFYAITVDPLHVGTGGYRLGRVDNTIVRDPGTDLPKVPGSSISGVCRNYTIYGLQGGEKNDAITCATSPNKKIKNNCGQCAVCAIFGFSSGEETGAVQGHRNQMGLVKFFDAQIAAFPVSTMYGPVWVTTKPIIEDLGGSLSTEPGHLAITTAFELANSKLNLGWLYLDADQDTSLNLPESAGNTPAVEQIRQRLVVASMDLFSHIVNANLEVRTSVSIDFNTGAAESGQLFTYEAIPRACLLAFDIALDTFRCPDANKQEDVWKKIIAGLGLFEVMGLGGMNTRGFGRMRVLNIQPNQQVEVNNND